MSTSARPYHHGELRAALLDAADRLLDQGGDGAVALRECARQAGVSPSAAYRHFGDKDALLAALAARHFAEFGQALAGKPLREMGPAYVRFALARPGRFRLMFGPLLARRGRAPPLRDAAAAAFAALEAAASSPERALLAWAQVHGLAQLLLDGAIQGQGDPEAIIARLLA